MCKAMAPLDLLKELRQVFEHHAATFRKRQQATYSKLEANAAGARACACEQAIKKIDATLRDWA